MDHFCPCRSAVGLPKFASVAGALCSEIKRISNHCKILWIRTIDAWHNIHKRRHNVFFGTPNFSPTSRNKSAKCIGREIDIVSKDRQFFGVRTVLAVIKVETACPFDEARILRAINFVMDFSSLGASRYIVEGAASLYEFCRIGAFWRCRYVRHDIKRHKSPVFERLMSQASLQRSALGFFCITFGMKACKERKSGF